MNKKYKMFCIALISILFLVSITGCAAQKTEQLKVPSSVSIKETTDTSKPTVTDPPEVEAEADITSSTNNEASIDKASESAVVIDEAIIFEQNGIKVTVKGYDPEGYFGPSIKLLIENDSSRSITVQSRSTSVNGYMIDTILSADVSSGKKANDSLTLEKSDLEAANITTIADIEFSLHIFDSDSWDTIVDSDMITIRNTAANGFTYSYDDSGDKVYDKDSLQIVVKGLSEGDSWTGPSVIVYIYNASEKDITAQVREVSVNGFMVDAIFSCDIMAGKRAIDSISFMSSELEENGIDKIEDVELSFHIFDYSSWKTITDTSPIMISFD